jgi:CRISPR/Cas system-associated exonuclease Cas4 (RecB family)
VPRTRDLALRKEKGACRVIRASDIDDFVFCERKWWLKLHNYFGKVDTRDMSGTAQRMEAGTELHRQYFKEVRVVSGRRRVTRVLIAISILLIGIALFVVLVGRGDAAAPRSQHRAPEIKSPKQSSANSLTLEEPARVIGGIVITTAFGLLLLAFLLRHGARRREKRWKMPAGNVNAVDDGSQENLVCYVRGLVGRPDAVRQEGRWFVPEEIKSANLPEGRRPYWGHTLQLAAYCYLVEKNKGPVKSGILHYSNRVVEVSYTDELRQKLIAVVNRMAMARSVGAELPRSHQEVARCAGCVARNICCESLASG